MINSIVEDGFSVTARRLRSVPVAIDGSTYIPLLPIEIKIKEELNIILLLKNPVEKALKSLLFVMKKRIFLDGTKRAAVVFANHILISSGKGLIVIPAESVKSIKDY